jgi:hypothetical protein
MPYLPTVPPEEAAGDVKTMYDKDLAAQGYVTNHTRVFSRRPEVLQGWLALKNAITSGMDPRLYELVTVAVATAIRSSYCSLAKLSRRCHLRRLGGAGCRHPRRWAPSPAATGPWRG